MGTEWTDNRKNLMLFSGRAHPELAEQVAKELDVPVTAQTARDFANGARQISPAVLPGVDWRIDSRTQDFRVICERGHEGWNR